MQSVVIQMHNRIPYEQMSTKTQVFQQQTEHKILRQIKQRTRQVKWVMWYAHSALKIDWTLQDNHMFTCVHLTHEEGWWPVGTVIATHTNFFSLQWEHDSIISPNKRMIVISLLQQLEAEDLIKGIIKKKDDQIESGNTTPLIDDLEMQDVFKDKDEEREDGVTDLINGLVDCLSLETRAVWDA